MKIVMDSDIPWIAGVFEPFAEVVYIPGGEITSSDVADADALVVRTRTRCDQRLLGGSRVRLVATATVGFDHIDTDFCRRAGIGVATAAGSNARAVLQWVAAALVHASREQGWSPPRRTLGVVGVGHVGALVADYARQWGFDPVCCDPPRQRSGDPAAAGFTTLNEVAERCDIVTFHTPLTHAGDDATYHLAGRDFFGSLRRGTLIFNASRGEVVDGQALTQAMADNAIACCLDTWSGEPTPDRDLLQRSLLATPHIAGYSVQGKANATAMVVEAVSREFGLPLRGWYPTGVTRVESRPIGWQELCDTIGDRFDIASLSRTLKAAPDSFESMRNNYNLRQEYF